MIERYIYIYVPEEREGGSFILLEFFGLKINEEMTKIMTQSTRKTRIKQNVIQSDDNFEQVESFVSLGKTLKKDNNAIDKINRQLFRLVLCYGSETWSVN